MNNTINIKQITYKLFLGLFLATLFSCKKDFLENTDKTRLTDVSQWASEGNADIFLNDIYADLSNKWNSPNNLDNYTDDNDAGFYWLSYAWRQGIVDPTVNGGAPMGNNTDNAVNYANWAAGYLKIRECNVFIQKLKENSSNFSDAYLQKRLDEARFLRAYFYSELFMHLGGLPIITNVLDRGTMDSTKIYNARNTFEQTFNFITSELDTVVNNNTLPVKYKNGDNDAGRATLGAALALKGWLELYAASPAFNAPTPASGTDPNKLAGFGNFDAARWAKAAATNKKFMDLYGGTYSLFPDLNSLWWEKNEYNSEVIWDRQVVPIIMGSNYEQYGGPVWINGVYYTWGNYDPTQELVDQFAMANGKPISDPTSGYDPQNPYLGREKRFYDFIVYDGAIYKQDWMEKPDTIYTRIDKVHPSKNQIDFGTDDVGNTGYYFKKKINPLKPRGGAASGENYVYYRYAEVLLNYAEAQNEAAGPDASVYDAINKIRSRSNLPALPAGLSQSQMRAAIYRERRVELCFEAKRFYDIIRWKIGEDVLNKDLHGMKITNSSPTDNSGKWIYEVVGLNHPHVFSQKMYLNPVPQTVIDQNKKIIQNPGY
ncbi:RagB/SusD family nutrient uptake outer membrane protein [Segetibacter koreensis]|uniref:RagB/SusD family nutrient uptake outer membrane protein n=1 Tax=Segetibacter koreensis TaxID=398037 RepID=UPI00035D525B|nr:RagB/SusD family nutrient uptake outer membrane protein [Segetibacter koreensis]